MVQIGDTDLIFVSPRSPRSPTALPKQLVATRLHPAGNLRLEQVQHQPSLLKSKIFTPALPNPTISYLPIQQENSTPRQNIFAESRKLGAVKESMGRRRP